MNSFSISQLEQFSGIKAHTIRIWEQRYNALTPDRSEGNTRYYDNTQLRRLLNIVSLLAFDYKVSELCAKSDTELYKLLNKTYNTTPAANGLNTSLISQLIHAGMTFDETTFDKLFSHCILTLGVPKTYTDIIYPMMVRVGLMWTTEQITPAYEHFISNMIRQKLFTAINSLPPAPAKAESWILFLPENELHEIGLVFAHYLIRASGRKVIYLGQNIPLDTLKQASLETKTSHLLCFMVHNQIPAAFENYMLTLKNIFPKTNIYIAGNEKLFADTTVVKNIHKIVSVEDLLKLLPTYIV
jgi:methanogenic corrinoid protein MtbC1